MKTLQKRLILLAVFISEIMHSSVAFISPAWALRKRTGGGRVCRTFTFNHAGGQSRHVTQCQCSVLLYTRLLSYHSRLIFKNTSQNADFLWPASLCYHLAKQGGTGCHSWEKHVVTSWWILTGEILLTDIYSYISTRPSVHAPHTVGIWGHAGPDTELMPLICSYSTFCCTLLTQLKFC